MKTNLKPLIDEGYRYFAIDDSEGGLNGAIMGKFKLFDDAKNFYNDTLYVIYTADRLVEKFPDFFEIKEEPELDLTQILQECPVDMKLYSTLHGEVKYNRINTKNPEYPVEVFDYAGNRRTFTKDGKFWQAFPDAECMLFPSRKNRDWSTFKPEQPKPKFEPFDRVLVRDRKDDIWLPQFYSHYCKGLEYPHFSITGCGYKMCIPYEGNEALLGTTNEPKQ